MLSVSANASECTPAGTVEALQGRAEVRHDRSTLWKPITINTPLCQRDQLRTLELSRASIRLVNQTLVQLEARTTLNLNVVENTDTGSVLGLIRGLIHTMSRVPRALEIHTPFVNAAIEGTEFVVAAADNSSRVAVLEGIVKVSNPQGEVRLGANESANAEAGDAPQKHFKINPLEGVSWEVTYLPLLRLETETVNAATASAWRAFQSSRPDLALQILDSGESTGESETLIRAASLLSLGMDKQAGAVLSDIAPASARSLALQAVIAIGQNQAEAARHFIDSALQVTPTSSEALLAESYLKQSQHDLSGALNSAQKAFALSPANPLIASRISELNLMSGSPHKALSAAREAINLDPEQGEAHKALGFALLHTGKAGEAQSVFETALAKNSYSSQNHLGLGLSKIRQGNISAGRANLETAALLEPANSLLRSYLGKAYYTEMRTPLAYHQYTLAKQHDPADPTPWFYEALALQDDNRAIEALQSMDKSIGLNDNRAVYRASSLLDDDRSSRIAATGSIYHALGFNQLALTPATISLASAPGNANAHRFLADSYVGQHHQDLARMTELQTSRLLAPVNTQMIPGNLLRNHSVLLEHSGPLAGGYTEHNNLFSKSGAYGHAKFSVGSLDTYSSDLTAGLIGEDTSLHASLYTLSTDGEYANTDYETTLGSIELKWDLTPSFRLTLLHDEDDADKGIPSQQYFFSPENQDQARVNTESSTSALGVVFQYSPATQIIGRVSDLTSDAQTTIPGGLGGATNVVAETTSKKVELQWAQDSRMGQWLTGAERNNADLTSTLSLATLPAPIVNEFKLDEETLYTYLMSTNQARALTTTLGLEHKKAYSPATGKPSSRSLPKFGMIWSINDQWNLGLAYFETMTPTTSLTANLSLQPTQIAGFNQVHRGSPTSHGQSRGISLEWKRSPGLSAGIRYLNRDNSNEEGFTTFENETPVIQHQTLENRIDNRNAWLYWSLNKRLSLALEHQYDTFSDEFEILTGITTDGLEELKTHRSPITLTYHPTERLSASWVNTYIEQKGIFWKNPATPVDNARVERGKESFWLMDASLSYRLAKRRGQWTVGVKNLLGEDYRYEDYSSYDPLLVVRTWVPSEYTEDRFWYTSLSLQF